MISPTLRSGACRWWRAELRPILLLALLVFSIRSSLADWNDVPSGSMKPTILEGDRVYVNKLAYDLKIPFTTRHLLEWADPQRREQILFAARSVEAEPSLIGFSDHLIAAATRP